MPYHQPRNYPNRPKLIAAALPRIRPQLRYLRRPQAHPRYPFRNRQNPTKSAPFMKPSTCSSRKKVASNLIRTPITAHRHPAYQVSMISEDTPPLTKLGASSLTYPPLVRHLPADHPPFTRRLARTRRERPIGSLRAFDIFAPLRSAHSLRKPRRDPCGNPQPRVPRPDTNSRNILCLP